MKIVLAVASLRMGGAERVVATLGAAMLSAGHRVSIVTESSADTDYYRLEDGLRRIALDVEQTTTGALQKLAVNVSRIRSLRAAILAEHPQVVVAFGDTISVRALAALCGSALPVVVSERTDPRQHRIPKIWTWLRRHMYRRAAAVVAQTESVAQWARSFVDPGRVHVIPNPVRSLAPEKPRPDAMPIGNVAMGMGRLSAEKGFAHLIEAFARSSLPSQNWSLVILGDGPDRAALAARVDELGLRGRVTLPGPVAEPEHWLRRADLFVLPSLYEGFPNALLEAMASGAAVIAYDCPSGPAEIVRQDETGLLVPAGDVDALTSAMRNLARDLQRRQRLAEAAARDVAVRFSLPVVLSVWDELLTSAAAGG